MGGVTVNPANPAAAGAHGAPSEDAAARADRAAGPGLKGSDRPRGTARASAPAHFDDPVLDSMARRRSISSVGPGAPSDEELKELLAAVTPVADHKALRPWRLITLRGDDRLRLGEALDEASGTQREPGEINRKPLRSDLLIAVVAKLTEHPKVPAWEQLATAAGAAHLLELALWQAGWGVMWRSGLATDAEPVRAAHGLAADEQLLGWLYVGSVDDYFKKKLAQSSRPPLDPEQFLSRFGE